VGGKKRGTWKASSSGESCHYCRQQGQGNLTFIFFMKSTLAPPEHSEWAETNGPGEDNMKNNLRADRLLTRDQIRDE